MYSFANTQTIMSRKDRLKKRDKAIYNRYLELNEPGKWTYSYILNELAKKFFLSETRIQDIICEQRKLAEPKIN